MIDSEIEILKVSNHPNIIGYKGHSETDEKIYIILELFKAIPLNLYLKQKCGCTPRFETPKINSWVRHRKPKQSPKSTRLKEEQ
jgi:serine/threonine protein kinase